MATPSSVTISTLNDQWGMVGDRRKPLELFVSFLTLSCNQKFDLCDDPDPMLRIQGVPWLLRKILSYISVTVAMKTWHNDVTGQSMFRIEYKPPLGLPASAEERAMDFGSDELKVPIMGRLRVRVRLATSNELEGVNGFLATGFEERKNIYMLTEHLDNGAETHQVFGFEMINGTRYHTRHIYIKRGDETAQLRLVYYYIGPRPVN